MKNKIKYVILSLSLIFNASAVTNIVAAENFYGELAKEIGGSTVKVQSIISNPDADPHLFTTSSATSKAISQADIIIYNGANYDDWIHGMLTNVNSNKVIVIDVSALANVKSGQNPHLWYKDDTFPLLARLLATKLTMLNPSKALEIKQNLTKFLTSYSKVIASINKIKIKYHGTIVTATEPVFGYMASAMGLEMQGLDFQWKVMNNTEPSPQMVANYEDMLNKKTVKVLFYNSQVIDSITQNMKDLATRNNIRIVGVTETMPNNMKINTWLMNEVNATDKALGK